MSLLADIGSRFLERVVPESRKDEAAKFLADQFNTVLAIIFSPKADTQEGSPLLSNPSVIPPLSTNPYGTTGTLVPYTPSTSTHSHYNPSSTSLSEEEYKAEDTTGPLPRFINTIESAETSAIIEENIQAQTLARLAQEKQEALQKKTTLQSHVEYFKKTLDIIKKNLFAPYSNENEASLKESIRDLSQKKSALSSSRTDCFNSYTSLDPSSHSETVILLREADTQEIIATIEKPLIDLYQSMGNLRKRLNDKELIELVEKALDLLAVPNLAIYYDDARKALEGVIKERLTNLITIKIDEMETELSSFKNSNPTSEQLYTKTIDLLNYETAINNLHLYNHIRQLNSKNNLNLSDSLSKFKTAIDSFKMETNSSILSTADKCAKQIQQDLRFSFFQYNRAEDDLKHLRQVKSHVQASNASISTKTLDKSLELANQSIEKIKENQEKAAAAGTAFVSIAALSFAAGLARGKLS